MVTRGSGAEYSAAVSIRTLVACAAVLLMAGACTSTVDGHPVLPGTAGTDTNPAAVRRTFQTYQQAILSGNGRKAASVVSSSAYDFYDSARDMALHACQRQLDSESPITRLTVYIMRAEFTVDGLRAASAKQLIAAAVNKGLVSKRIVRRYELGDIDITGNSATAVVMLRGRPAPFEFNFTRQYGKWYFDLTALFELSNKSLRTLAEHKNMSMRTLIDRALTVRYGRQQVDTLHQPLLDKSCTHG